MRIICYASALCLFASSAALPAFGRDGGPLLTAALAVEQAVARSPELSAEREVVRAQQQAAAAVPLLANPVLELEGASGSLTGSPDEQGFGVTLSQEVPLSAAVSHRRAVARADAEIARLLVEERRNRLADEVRRAWSAAAIASQRLELVRGQTAVAESLHAIAKERFRAGDLPEFDVLQAGLDLQRQQLRQTEEEAALGAARRQLAFLMGLAAEQELPPLAPAVLPPRIEQTEEQLLLLAEQRRTDLQAYVREVDRDQASLSLAQAEAIPALTVSVSYRHERSAQNSYELIGGGLVPGKERTRDHLLGVKLSIPIPLFGRNQAEVARAAGRLGAGRYRVEAVRRSAAAEVRDLLVQHRMAVAASERHRSVLVPASRENLQIQEAAFRLGEIGMQPVLDEKRRLAEQQEAELKALQLALDTYSRLEAAVGGGL